MKKKLYKNLSRESLDKTEENVLKIPQIEIKCRIAHPGKLNRLLNNKSSISSLESVNNHIDMEGRKETPEKKCVQALNFNEVFIRSPQTHEQTRRCVYSMLRQKIPCSLNNKTRFNILNILKSRKILIGDKKTIGESDCKKGTLYNKYLTPNNAGKRIKRRNVIQDKKNDVGKLMKYEKKLESINLLLNIPRNHIFGSQLNLHSKKRLIKKQKENLKQQRIFGNNAIFDLSKAIYMRKNVSE